MKFYEFIDACRRIKERIGREKFLAAPLRLHDVGKSSQFAQAVFPAGSVQAGGGEINVCGGRGGGLKLVDIVAKAAEAAQRANCNPRILACGDRSFVFGYDPQANAAVMSYDIPEEDLDESILDSPRPEMDPSVWADGPDGPELTDAAKLVVDAVAAWAVGRYGISPSAGVRIVGSIASNSYSDESDVDVHFYGKNIDFGGKTKEDFNRDFRKAFAKFAEENQQYASVGGHPVEVFAQKNEFQDMTSVGCYNVRTGEWEAGPGVKGTAYDPYADFYDDDMALAGGLVTEIRQAVMAAYEKATVFKKATDQEFKARIGAELGRLIAEAARLFKKIKEMRKTASDPEPQSREEALAKREDRRWHVADSAFKLLDKFGYTDVCWTCKDLAESGAGADEAARAVLDAIADNVAKNAALPESERDAWNLDGTIQEGFGSSLKAAALAGMTFAAGLGAPAAQTAKAVPKDIAASAQRAEKKYGGLSKSNLVNLLATVAYNEAMLDWMKDESDDSLTAVLNVVQNRAGKDPCKFAQVISRKSQFFSAKHVKGGYEDATYATYSPSAEAAAKGGQLSPRQEECWRKCVKLAGQAVDGTLPNKIGNRNMMANRRKDKTSAWNAWGKDCDLQIGSHTFGYDPTYDPAAKKGSGKTHVVKKGDSLWGIARANGTTVEKIKKDNGLKSDVITPGQQLKIKS